MASLYKFRAKQFDRIEFGSYPQSKKDEYVKVSLNDIADKERNYYLGSDNEMYYYFRNTFFKVEPITWQIVKRNGDELWLVSEKVIDNRYFDRCHNDYKGSFIRRWLNDYFYNKAFTEEQKALIETTLVKNDISQSSVLETDGVCDDTNDKVFLLSPMEGIKIYNERLDFGKAGTAYAKSRRLYINDSGYAYWFFRTTKDGFERGKNYFIRFFDSDVNYITAMDGVSERGIVPSIKINLNGTIGLDTDMCDDFICGFMVKDGILVKYNGAGGDVVIPEGVTKIGEEAFYNCPAVESITLPKSIKEIGDWAFGYCTSLKSINLDGVIKIGKGVFYECENLIEVAIPEGVTKIEWHTFCRCKSLTTVTLPQSLTAIEEYAFYKCSSITDLVLPTGLNKIGESAFRFAFAPIEQSIIVPMSVEEMGGWAIIPNKNKLKILCRIESKPRGWKKNCFGCDVVWGYKE